MWTIASFLRDNGYLNFIKGPISHVLLLILDHVLLPSCLFFFLTSCFTAIKNHVIKYCTAVYEKNGEDYFGLLKIQAKFFINYSLDVF